jgi:DNA processing protein
MRTNHDELHHRLALWRLPGMGPATFNAVIQHFGSATTALRAPTQAWARLRIRPALIAARVQPDWAGAERDLHWLQASGHHLISHGDRNYPELLAWLPEPPPLLFVAGEAELLRWPQLAVVGSRSPSLTGVETAGQFAGQLAAAGLVITSGLAVGIDAAAHQAGLAVDGRTIAVIGTGPDRCYPPRHRALVDDIITAGGAVVSEFPTGIGPQRQHFPRRNRLISGLSLATLVVEADLHSGSLITARYALEQGRDVYAIPGSIHNPLARGCNALIKRAEARLIDSIDDILEELAAVIADQSRSGSLATDAGAIAQTTTPEAAAVLNALGHDPVGTDQLCQRCGLTTDLVSSILLQLELQGLVEALRGGRFQRRTPIGPSGSPR